MNFFIKLRLQPLYLLLSSIKTSGVYLWFNVGYGWDYSPQLLLKFWLLVFHLLYRAFVGNMGLIQFFATVIEILTQLLMVHVSLFIINNCALNHHWLLDLLGVIFFFSNGNLRLVIGLSKRICTSNTRSLIILSLLYHILRPCHHRFDLDLNIEDLVLVIIWHSVEIKHPCFELIRIERFLLYQVFELSDFISGLIIESLDIPQFSFLLVLHGLYRLFWHKFLVEIFFKMIKLNFDLTHNELERYFVLCTYLVNDCKCRLLLIFSDDFVVILPALQVSSHDLWRLLLSLSVFADNHLPFLLRSENYCVVDLILNKNWLS